MRAPTTFICSSSSARHSCLHPLPRLLHTDVSPHTLQQSPPHHAQPLHHRKIERPMHRAPWPPPPAPPVPSRPAAEFTPPSLAHRMPLQQYPDHHQEPYREFLDNLRLDWLLTAESLHPLFKLLTEQPMPYLLHIAHDCQSGSTMCEGRVIDSPVSISPSMTT